MTKYTTIQGDTWDIIAKKVYGQEHKMHLLIQANFKRRTVVVFGAGEVLDVPALPDNEALEELPPWRRSRAGG